MRRKGGKRPLAPGEKALWQKVTDTVTPRPGAILPTADIAAEDEPPSPLHLRPGRRRLSASLRAETAIAPPSNPPPALDAGDPHMARRVARGRLAIDATLDLHGLTQVEARTRLFHFIDFAALRGDRVLLVITGKGRPSDEDRSPFGEAPRGILRLRFLDWVEETPLREKIASVRQSHQRHGGSGAFYVFLRAKETRRL